MVLDQREDNLKIIARALLVRGREQAIQALKFGAGMYGIKTLNTGTIPRTDFILIKGQINQLTYGTQGHRLFSANGQKFARIIKVSEQGDFQYANSLFGIKKQSRSTKLTFRGLIETDIPMTGYINEKAVFVPCAKADYSKAEEAAEQLGLIVRNGIYFKKSSISSEQPIVMLSKHDKDLVVQAGKRLIKQASLFIQGQTR